MLVVVGGVECVDVCACADHYHAVAQSVGRSRLQREEISVVLGNALYIDVGGEVVRMLVNEQILVVLVDVFAGKVLECLPIVHETTSGCKLQRAPGECERVGIGHGCLLGKQILGGFGAVGGLRHGVVGIQLIDLVVRQFYHRWAGVDVSRDGGLADALHDGVVISYAGKYIAQRLTLPHISLAESGLSLTGIIQIFGVVLHELLLQLIVGTSKDGLITVLSACPTEEAANILQYREVGVFRCHLVVFILFYQIEGAEFLLQPSVYHTAALDNRAREVVGLLEYITQQLAKTHDAVALWIVVEGLQNA